MSRRPTGIVLRNTYDVPALEAGHRLRPVLDSALRAAGVDRRRPSLARIPAWDAAHFGLRGVRAFETLGAEARESVLREASRATLVEAYFIEKSGMSFTAKMALLSRTTQERMLYSLFSADETAHLCRILSHLESEPTAGEGGPFVALLDEIIRGGDRESLVVLIQVLLEGWGISHYHRLAENCRDPELRASIRSILRDEARHHGSGMVLSREIRFSRAQKSYLLETLETFLSMVRCGPQGLFRALESGCGKLSKKSRRATFAELGCEADSSAKLETIRGLLLQGGCGELVSALDKTRSFTPLSSDECADISA